MKIIIILAVWLSAASAFAVSNVRFLPLDRNVVTTVAAKDVTGNSDSDPMDLYAIMNVDEQDSSMGKGKAIKTAEKDFNLVCGKEKQLCTIVLNKSARTMISSAQKLARFEVTGDAAAELTRQFKVTETGEAYFRSVEKNWYLHGTSNSFIFETTGR